MCLYVFLYLYIHSHAPTPTHSTKISSELLRIAIYQKVSDLDPFPRRTACIFYILPFWFLGFWIVRENCLGSRDPPRKDLTESMKEIQCPINLPRIRKDGLATKLHWIRNPRLENLGWWHLKAAFQDFFSGFEVNSIESFPQLFARHPQGLPFRCTMGI